MVYRDMAIDAGYSGDEADQVAAELEQQHREEEAKEQARQQLPPMVMVNANTLDAIIDALGPASDEVVEICEEEHGPLVVGPAPEVPF